MVKALLLNVTFNNFILFKNLKQTNYDRESEKLQQQRVDK